MEIFQKMFFSAFIENSDNDSSSSSTSKMSLTPRQIEEIDELELHFSRGNEKRRKYDEAIVDQVEMEFFERDFESDFFDLHEDTVLDPIEKPKVLLARLVSPDLSFQNL